MAFWMRPAAPCGNRSTKQSFIVPIGGVRWQIVPRSGTLSASHGMKPGAGPTQEHHHGMKPGGKAPVQSSLGSSRQPTMIDRNHFLQASIFLSDSPAAPRKSSPDKPRSSPAMYRPR